MKRERLFLLFPIFIFSGLIFAFSASATMVCPTASPLGVGCPSEGGQQYYCNSGCRLMDAAYCPTNELAAASPCATLDACGVCNTCISSYLLCTASTYPTRSCTYNDPANHCATLVNSNCNAGECASCTSGYSLCSTDHTCIATQSCETWETFNACTNACEGTAPTLKLSFSSAGNGTTGNNVLQSATSVLAISPSSLVGIGTTTPNARLEVIPATGYSILAGNFKMGNIALPTADGDAATKGYVDSVLASSSASFWGGLGNDIWNTNTGNVGIGNTAPTQGLDIGSETLGLNTRINSTLGSDQFTSFTVSGNWTLTAGWQATNDSGTDLNKNAAGVTTATFTGFTPTIGTTYKLSFTINASVTGGTAVSFGGVVGTPLNPVVSSSTVYTMYIKAATAGQLIFTPVTTARFVITNISIKPLTAGTGTLILNGDMMLSGSVESSTGNNAFSINPNGSVVLPVMSGPVSGITTLAIGGTLTGVTSMAHSSTITGSVASLFVPTLGIAENAGAAATGLTAALIPMQYSPSIRWLGYAWNTTGTPASNYYHQRTWAEPYVRTTGSGAIDGRLKWELGTGVNSVAERDYEEIMSLGRTGGVDELNVLGQTFASESLANPSLTGGTNWTANNGGSGGVVLSGDAATYTHNAAQGALSQDNATMTANGGIALKPNRWYRFTYTTSAPVITVRAYIDETYTSAERIYLPGVTPAVGVGNMQVTFKTNSSPSGFRINFTSAVGAITFDTFSLREVTSGNIVANGLFTGGGTSGLKIDNTGNVGIGLTAPAARLDVLPATGYSILAGNFKIGSVALPTADGDVATKGYVDSVISSATSSITTLWGGTTDGTIWNLNSGNVGIGKSNPGYKLDVNGDINIAYQKSIYLNTNQLIGQAIDSGYHMQFGLLGSHHNFVDAWTDRLSMNVYNGTTILNALYIPAGNVSNAGYVGIGTTIPRAVLNAATTVGGSTLNPVVRVQSMGSGVGSGPSIDFANIWSGAGTWDNWVQGRIGSVYDGSTTNGGALVFYTNNSGGVTAGSLPTEKMRIRPDGNVGIGTAVPGVKLTLPVNNYIGFEFGGGNTAVYNKIGKTYATYPYATHYIANGADHTYDVMHAFDTNTGTKLVILNDGNVGIGTSTPNARLEVIPSSGYSIFAGNYKIGNVAAPTADSDVATMGWVNSALSSMSAVAVYSTSTPATYSGSQSGYSGANALCAATVSGSHVCTTGEILNTINNGLGSSIPASTFLWVSNGPPAYTANANDCMGWTSAVGTNYGTIWIKLASGDGFGSLNTCDTVRSFACCK